MKRVFLLTTILLVLIFFVAGCKEKSQPPAVPHTHDSIDLSKYKEAETLAALLRNDPDNLRALIKLGNIYFDIGRNEDAVTTYRRALALDPGNADVRTDMGICLRRLNKTEEAIEAFEKSIDSNPHHYQSRYNLGLVLLHEKNDLQGALEAWEGLLKAVPEFPGRDVLALQVEKLKQTRPVSNHEEKK